MKRIVFLDYVRVFACFLVMIVHASENFYGAAGSTDMAGPQSYLPSEADRLWVAVYDGFSRMAVPLFMIVSAFLLAPMKEGQTTWQFYRQRFIRIVPPFFIFMILYSTLPMLWGQLNEETSLKDLSRIFLNFLLPVLMIISIALGTYITLGSAKTMEAFLFVIIFMSISMLLQGIPFQEIMNTLTQGIKGAVPAVTLLALAYSINALSKDMGTANYIVSLSESFLTPAMLPAIIFIISAIMAFATGSSWGTFAICMPIALPLAFTFTGGELGTLVYACFGAVAGGGVFGDHCSPLSDTTVLSSTGSASDHIDHVQTQLPYALCCGTLAVILYLVIGFAFV